MFEVAEAYEVMMGRWSRQLAPLFVEFVGVRDGEKVLDIGCGTASLYQRPWPESRERRRLSVSIRPTLLSNTPERKLPIRGELRGRRRSGFALPRRVVRPMHGSTRG